MVIDNKKENVKIYSLIKDIINSTKPKAIASLTQKLIKLIQPLQLNIEINATSLFEKINEIQDKFLYIELGNHLFIKVPNLIEPKVLTTLFDYTVSYPFEDNIIKFQFIKTLTRGFTVVPLFHTHNIFEFVFFDFILKEETFSQEILLCLYNMLCNSNLSHEITELIIDTCIIKAFGFRNEKNKIYDLLPFILQIIQFYIEQLSFKKASVIKNIITLLSYFTFVIQPVKGNTNFIDLWAYMCICYQKDGNKTFRYLLNIIMYYPIISNSFSGMEAFDSLDNNYHINNIIFDKKTNQNKYEKFFKKQEINNVLQKEKIIICRGAILLIKWSLWGYKKINTIKVSNSVILSQLFKLIKETTEVSLEIFRCIQRLVKKYGKLLVDEWNFIYKIIGYISEKELEWSTDVEKDNIVKDIVHHINLFRLDYHYYGDVFKANQISKTMKPSNSGIDIIIKINLLLLSKEDFYGNYQGIIIEHLINSKSIQIKSFIMEMIRYVYSFSLTMTKATIIEDNLVKYYNEIIKSFEDDETNLFFFSHLLTTISSSTTEITILEKIFKSILSHQPDLDKKERKKNYEKFQYSTLRTIYDKINNNFQRDKAEKFNNFFLKNESFLNEKIIKFDMWLITKLLVNENNEIFLSNTNKLQLLILNFKFSSFEPENKLCDYKNQNIDIYKPYVGLKHNKLFAYLIIQLKKDETTSALCEDILEFFLKALKKIFFFQDLMLVNIIQEIIETDDISKYSSRKKMVYLLEEILINICYHLSFNLINEQAYNTDINSNTSILNIKSENLKAKSLYCLLNSFESFSIMFNEIIKRFKTFIQFEKYQLNSIKNKFILDVNAFEQNNIPQKSSNETQLTFFVVLSYLMKTITSLHFYFVSIIPYSLYQNNINYDQINFNSFDSRFDLKNINGLENIQYFNKEFSELIKRFLNDLMANIWLCEYIQNYPIAVLHCLIGMKELLWEFGDSVIIKIIYIALILGYSEEQNNIESAFEAYLGFRYQKNKKLDDMFLLHDKSYKEISLLKQDFISQLADIVIIYYLRKVKISSPMLMIINRIFCKKNNIKDKILIDYCNWALTIKGNRDELEINQRKIVHKNSQFFYGNYNLIMVTPIQNHSYDVIIRNCISNVSINFNAHFENDFYIKCSFQVLLKEINKNQETLHNKNKTHQHFKSKDDFFILTQKKQIQYKTHKSNSQKNILNLKYLNTKKMKERGLEANNIIKTLINLSTLPYSEFKQMSNNDYVANQISLLDEIPIYKTYYCGIIFFPNLTHITQYDVLSYNSSVNDRFLSFINSLGYLYNIIENVSLSLGSMHKDGSDGNYVICYKDSFYHLVFHISNLLIPLSFEDPANIITVRKRILSQDYINIIWMDNPLLDCNENYFFSQSIKIFVIIHPLSSTHYQINRRYNDKAKEIELHKAIDPYLNNDYVLNFKCKCSVEYFIQSLLTMHRIIDYMLKESQEKDMCLIDNILTRMNIIQCIKHGQQKSHKKRDIN